MAGDKPEDLTKQQQAELEKVLKRYARVSGWQAKPLEVPVGQSPKQVIWARNKARLYYYEPTTPSRFAVPLLMIYALVNRAYILDLRPGASLVEYLVQQGYSVYLLDWGTPGPEDKNLKLDDYVLDYIPRAVKHVLKHANAPQISLLGYCLGGALTICFAALRPDLPLKNMVLMATPVDFSEKSLMRDWVDPASFNLDQMVEAYGLIPAEVVDFGSKMLKPYNNFVGTYNNFWDKLWDERATESWLSMNKWVNDGVPFAGAAFRQWIQEFYLGNKLASGQLYMRGQKVDMQRITTSLLNIVAERDHIALPSQSTPIMNLVGSTDKQQITLPGGHVGLVVGRGASTQLWPALHEWLALRSCG